ncbi:elongation factor P [Metamycoplasma hyosynoviae]|uniref:elongation factor P n=1 Tax=Metamycoplasma hyosynoviae TaxID=29559 RepID=UPI0023588CE8|nr:elongation factor P [Metamycoplasma hyosynoviae]MDC8901063.1 elongation factor P [Metamycoplasma hyosynoviae]MDC8912589.1 elongation factor P [Metamycoplasma hyosynoviae]MDC8913096.1 elongation factor P [Metamycoplasma hyosynoviae]MDC8914947.1 elongation factor P [Metamycoplasma hyosynoviae]
MISVNDLRPGFTFKHEDNIYIVLEAAHSKQGRGQANVKIKAKDLRSGSITVKSFTGGEKVERAMIDKAKMDYLYNSGEALVFMDQETFEQIEIPVKKVEWEMNFLKEGDKIQVRKFQEEILDIELEVNVALKVVSSPEAVRGNTAQVAQKKVIVETGFEVETPLFIKEGEIILISTETGKYVGRA